MDFEWDTAKRAQNFEKHGVDFEAIRFFDWDIALTVEDTRGSYVEARFVSISLIGDRHYVAVWTMRDQICRLISLRKANKREVKSYVAQQIIY